MLINLVIRIPFEYSIPYKSVIITISVSHVVGVNATEIITTSPREPPKVRMCASDFDFEGKKGK